MVEQSHRFFSCAYGEGLNGKCFWFRVFGYGLHFKRHDSELLFSERYGYTPSAVIFGIRVKALKPSHTK